MQKLKPGTKLNRWYTVANPDEVYFIKTPEGDIIISSMKELKKLDLITEEPKAPKHNSVVEVWNNIDGGRIKYLRRTIGSVIDGKIACYCDNTRESIAHWDNWKLIKEED